MASPKNWCVIVDDTIALGPYRSKAKADSVKDAVYRRIDRHVDYGDYYDPISVTVVPMVTSKRVVYSEFFLGP